jgi:hypothetical protein
MKECLEIGILVSFKTKRDPIIRWFDGNSVNGTRIRAR